MNEQLFTKILHLINKANDIEVLTTDIQMKIANGFEYNKEDIQDDLNRIIEKAEEIQDEERYIYHQYYNEKEC